MLNKKTFKRNIIISFIVILILIPNCIFAQNGTGLLTIAPDSTAMTYAQKMFLDGSELLKKFVRFAGTTLMLFGLATIGISYRNSQGEDSMATQGVLMIAIGATIFSASFVNTGNQNFLTSMLTLTKVAFFAGGGLLTVMGLGNIGINLQSSQPSGVSKGIIQMVGGIIIAVSGVLFTGINGGGSGTKPLGT